MSSDGVNPRKFQMSVQSGKLLDPFDPDESHIHIEDIALGLSNNCRYGNQGLFHYSVAQHSIYMARELIRQDPDFKEEAFCAMVHDASEAYLVDIPKPIKIRPEMAAYIEAEAILQKTIYRKYQLPSEPYDIVNHLDRIIWGNEMPVLFPDGVNKCPHDEKIEGLVIERWTPERAFVEYITLFHKLARATQRE